MNPVLESDGDFFTQKLAVVATTAHSWDHCKYLSENKKVLHIGCSDWPIFNAKSNMHIYLKPFCNELVGVDINGLQEMQAACPGKYYSSIEELLFCTTEKEEWDTVLVPNIIEHLPNPGLMVEALFRLNFKTMFILVPNYKVQEQAIYEDGIFSERIHPDHYAWYSPYTLYNLIKKPIDPTTSDHQYEIKMMFFDNQNMISILITKI